jgi:hypothetical protein
MLGPQATSSATAIASSSLLEHQRVERKENARAGGDRRSEAGDLGSPGGQQGR